MSDAIQSEQFDGLLEYLRRARGFDFHAYKRPSLMRRVEKRMQAVDVDDFNAYTDYLEVHPEEFAELFNVILINVTSFFRDEVSWDYLRDDVMPALLTARPDHEPIRVWSAGCASGEEPYSLAMLLAERLGPDQFRERVKIYATDVDDHALNQARQASYTGRQVQTVPPALRERYFVQDGDRFVFDKELRRSVVFGRHDLIQDAPISRVDLLVCRNTLMYFNTEAQTRILARFHFALGNGSVLFLGKAEMLITHAQMFTPMDLRWRIFRKVAKDNWRERMAIMNQANGDEYTPSGNYTAVYPAVFDASPVPQIVIGDGGLLLACNDRARSLFNLAPNDLGRSLQDLQLGHKPHELRPLIEQALEQRRAMTLKDTEWQSVGREPSFFDMHIVPLFDSTGKSFGVSVSLADVSRVQELQAQLNRSQQELETAYEELQSTNEELETTNEELQSTVEELETTNEELQSTNEELETMNEELQATNEELQTINEELRERSDDLNRANSLRESILTGVRSGVIVIDCDLHVVAWNPRAEDLWGLRADEVTGQNFLSLDIGLPTGQLRAAIRACLAGDGAHSEVVVSAVNRRGRAIACRVTATPLLGPQKDVRGVILVTDEQMLAAAH